ncbi:ATP-binding protein [Anaerosporobacter sp.]|uniref:ATP-binding protein n=1 Tax=Anaerosporobacter sp. TaxID=1872529 RepID=UPI00286F1AF0|nr:ATP-binding protein [Anaerosporobacter sp.]
MSNYNSCSQLNSVDTFKITRDQLEKYFTGLVGFHKQRAEIDRVVKWCFNPDIDKKYWNFLHMNGNILLYGKPGTGKTSIAYECAFNNEKATFYSINLSSLISEKLGKTEKALTHFFEEVFQEAETSATVLLMEEIEAFLPNRSSSKDIEDMKRALTVFMHYLDLFIQNLVIICTTNHKDLLDPAIMRRFSFVYKIENSEKKDIIDFLTQRNNPFSSGFSNNEINNEIAEYVVEHKMTFSELKYHMKMIFISGEDSEGQNVNSANLLKHLKMEE